MEASKTQKALGKLILEQTTEGMLAVAERYRLLSDGRIDLRSRTLCFNHSGLDLRLFILENANLSGSRFANCCGEGASFRGCVLDNTWFDAEPGEKASLANACFDGCVITNSSLGPRTLDLRGTSFRGARLKEVRFRMARLNNACFANADLEDVWFRSGILDGADFSDSRLCRVSFEKAELNGVSFRNVRPEQMDFWGHRDLFETGTEYEN